MMRAVATLAAALAAVGCQTVTGAVDRAFQPDLYAEMADADVTMAVAAMQTVLESSPDGSGSAWSNPATGNSGRITPQRTWQTDEGYFCRDFVERLTIGGRSADYDRSACRMGDGTWQLSEV